MKYCLPMAALVVFAAYRDCAGTVELNGITSLFGEKMAFLILHEPRQTQPVSFSLVEGASRFGIRLLAVDAAGHRVRIEQDGSTTELQLRPTPELTLASMDDADLDAPLTRQLDPQEQLQLDQFLNQDDEVQRIKAGNPVVDPFYVGAPYPVAARTDGGNNTGNNNSSTGASSPAGADPSASGAANQTGNSPAPGQKLAAPVAAPVAASGGESGGVTGDAAVSVVNSSTGANSETTPGADYTTQYWYQASMGIERNRIATADQALSGAMEPLPRTPLTPSRTPASLIGGETYFANHIPGFPYSGSPD